MRQTLSLPSYQLSVLSYVLRTENRPAWLGQWDGSWGWGGRQGRNHQRPEKQKDFQQEQQGHKDLIWAASGFSTVSMTHIFIEQTFLLLTWSCAG